MMDDKNDRDRIVALASRLVEGMIERGEIECTEEAIKAAMPAAVRDAHEVLNATYEFLSG